MPECDLCGAVVDCLGTELTKCFLVVVLLLSLLFSSSCRSGDDDGHDEDSSCRLNGFVSCIALQKEAPMA